MCRALGVRGSGYYAWMGSPLSAPAHEDLRLQGLIRYALLESGSVYGRRKVAKDLHDWAET